jgi:hypothetical protein
MTIRAEPTLTKAIRRALDRHIESALRQSSRARANLRKVVRQAVGEMEAAGASSDDIHAFLTRSVEEHPQRHLGDRVSILTGLRASTVLTKQMLAWADHVPLRLEPTQTSDEQRSEQRSELRAILRELRVSER